MKKTIAILLVLVLAGVGLFAVEDTASMEITVAITPFSALIITDADPSFDGNSTYATFSGLTAKSTAEEVAKASATVGYLNYFSNKTTGLTTTFAATKLADDDATSPVSTVIGYVVTVGDKTATAGGASSAALTLVATGTTGTTLGSKAISVDVVDDDYDTAAVPVGDYIGTITFTYTTD